MLYRRVGKTGESASILGFGCMRLPTRGAKAHLIAEDKAQAMVDHAIRNGVNYFDTAYIYHSEVPFQAGMSEVFLGRALNAHRERVHVATKLPSWFIQSRADMDRYLDQQLDRLQNAATKFSKNVGLSFEALKNLDQIHVEKCILFKNRDPKYKKFINTKFAKGSFEKQNFVKK